MIELKSFFCDKVYLITTCASERIKETQDLLDTNKIKYDLYVACDYNVIDNRATWEHKDKHGYLEKDYRKSMSLVYAYKSIFYNALYKNYEQICILEDDIRFYDNWEEKFINFYVNVCNLDWSILNCGYHNSISQSILTPINKFVQRVQDIYYTTHFTIVNKKGINKLLHNIDHGDALYKPIDYYYIDVYNDKSVNCFIPREKIAYQKDDPDT